MIVSCCPIVCADHLTSRPSTLFHRTLILHRPFGARPELAWIQSSAEQYDDQETEPFKTAQQYPLPLPASNNPYLENSIQE